MSDAQYGIEWIWKRQRWGVLIGLWFVDFYIGPLHMWLGEEASDA